MSNEKNTLAAQLRQAADVIEKDLSWEFETSGGWMKGYPDDIDAFWNGNIRLAQPPTPQPPEGFHLATDEEKKCLPVGSLGYVPSLGTWDPSSLWGYEGKEGMIYACPDLPTSTPLGSDIAKEPNEEESDPRQAMKFALHKGFTLQRRHSNGVDWVSLNAEDARQRLNGYFPVKNLRIHPDDLHLVSQEAKAAAVQPVKSLGEQLFESFCEAAGSNVAWLEPSVKRNYWEFSASKLATIVRAERQAEVDVLNLDLKQAIKHADAFEQRWYEAKQRAEAAEAALKELEGRTCKKDKSWGAQYKLVCNTMNARVADLEQQLTTLRTLPDDETLQRWVDEAVGDVDTKHPEANRSIELAWSRHSDGYDKEGPARLSLAKSLLTRFLSHTKAEAKDEPKTFTGPDGKEYFPHSAGDPMPCAEEVRIEIVCREGRTTQPNGVRYLPRLARSNIWSQTKGWRYADTAPTKEKPQVALTPADVPPGSVVKAPTDSIHEGQAVVNVCQDRIYFSGPSGDIVSAGYQHLMTTGAQINRSIPLTGRWDSTAWEPCSKEASQPNK